MGDNHCETHMDPHVRIPFVLLIGLMVHAMAEGIALGVQNSQDSVAILAIGILMHKGAESVTLAVKNLNNGVCTANSVIIILVFASSSPLGIFCGSMLGELDTGLVSYISACCVGTFLFIGQEISSSEIAGDKNNNVSKWAMMVLGSAFVVLSR